MYLLQFFASLTKKNNIPILIYLVLNVALITWFFFAFQSYNGVESPNFWGCLGTALIFYVVSLFIALSPIGEWILRLQNGCKKITRKEQIAKIEPIFNEVYSKAKEMHPELRDDITLYIKGKSKRGRKNGEDGNEVNAFAVGRKTVCITEGLLYMPEEQIKAVLGHEFGHLAHHDTDMILLITVGNFLVTGIISTVLIICSIMKFFFALFSGGRESGIAGAVGLLMTALFVLLINLFNRIWSQIGVWLVMKASRSNEYLADEFSFNLGYGVPLCEFLDNNAGGYAAEGLFAALASSHPATDDRIAKLQELGCEYKKSY